MSDATLIEGQSVWLVACRCWGAHPRTSVSITPKCWESLVSENDQLYQYEQALKLSRRTNLRASDRGSADRLKFDGCQHWADHASRWGANHPGWKPRGQMVTQILEAAAPIAGTTVRIPEKSVDERVEISSSAGMPTESSGCPGLRDEVRRHGGSCERTVESASTRLPGSARPGYLETLTRQVANSSLLSLATSAIPRMFRIRSASRNGLSRCGSGRLQ